MTPLYPAFWSQSDRPVLSWGEGVQSLSGLPRGLSGRWGTGETRVEGHLGPDWQSEVPGRQGSRSPPGRGGAGVVVGEDRLYRQTDRQTDRHTKLTGSTKFV